MLKLPLATNPRAKKSPDFRDGFVKLFTSPGTGVVLGGVIVAPRASELILAISVAMEQRLTAEQLADPFAVYLPRQHHRGGPQADGVHAGRPASGVCHDLHRWFARPGTPALFPVVLCSPAPHDII